ncbi:prepilin peptidase [Frondihabitans cladoniiphilus]|uniref:A24 family peptidase n=1 Tax=Frondihabitans cladoniiphilus TaxID=715785 RepID=A0ABP8VWG8_9MICO
MIETSLLFATVLAAGFGLLIGSFLNVVVYRVPNGMSVATPPSACPTCHSEIRSYDNVPVLSWLVLRGKCRDCRTPISARYPIVELLTGVFFLVVALQFWPRLTVPIEATRLVSDAIGLVAFLYLAAVSVALAIIDAEHQRLPDRIVLPSYAVGFALLTTSSLLVGDWTSVVHSLIGGAALFVFYFAVAFVHPAGMAFGDIKLAGVLGLYLGSLGWGPLLVGAFAAFLVGGLYSVALLATKRIGRKGGIPFGPWMLAGAWIGIFFGPSLWTGYLTLFGLA